MFHRKPSRFLPLLALSLLFAGAVMAEDEEQISDPIEPVNRGIFWFNEQFDRFLFKPVAEAYDFIFPEEVKTGVGNIFSNLKYPVQLVSDVVQFKFTQAGTHTGRFLVNSTVGLAGFFDVATELGLEAHYEDFGTALGYHGVPPGPYLVLPILGPSNLRDGFGRLVDSFLDPVYWVAYDTADDSDAFAITLGARTLDGIDTRASLIDAIDSAHEASVDYYLFLQSAYYQHRDALIHDKANADPDNPFADEEEIDLDDDKDLAADADPSVDELKLNTESSKTE